MTDTVSDSSRRVLLGALSASPLIVAAATASFAMPLPVLRSVDPDPIILHRTKDSRRLSRIRYDCAEEFFPRHDPRSDCESRRFLYNAGVTAQLALLSYLMAIGFDDEWCARRVGYRPAFTLYHANRYGLDYDRPEMTQFADLLSPYWQWNSQYHAQGSPPPEVAFTPSEIRALLHDLLDHVGRKIDQHAPEQEATA